MQVRLGQVLGDGRVITKMLGEHQGSVHELAVEPGSPHILYSCGEDGLVQHVSESAIRSSIEAFLVPFGVDYLFILISVRFTQYVCKKTFLLHHLC